MKMSDNQARDNNYFSLSCTGRKKVILGSIQITIALSAIVVFSFLIVMEPSAATNKMLIHNHVSLNVTIGGKPIIVPSNIGIMQTGIFADPSLFADHSLDKYGMEGMSPLHTHDSSGLIHVESSMIRNFTLGEFLDIWKGLDTDGKNVIASVDGRSVLDFHNITLIDRAKIVLDITS
jgi:hypothetical protein